MRDELAEMDELADFNIDSGFNEAVFRDHVERALSSVRKVLDLERAAAIRPAGDTDHSYGDKYKLADGMVNSTIVAFLAVLNRLGLTPEVLERLVADDGGGTATGKKTDTILCFKASKSTTFVREEIVDKEVVPLTTKTTKTSSKTGTDGQTETTTEDTMTIETIVERIRGRQFDVAVEWELSVYSGTGFSNRTILQNRSSRTIVVHETKVAATLDPTPPPEKEEVYRYDPVELSLAWLFRYIDVRKRVSHFAIDVADVKATRTPLRNPQVQEALSFFHEASRWAQRVHGNLGDLVLHGKKNNPHEHRDLFGWGKFSLRNAVDRILVPVLPFLVEPNTTKKKPVRNEDENNNDDDTTSAGTDESFVVEGGKPDDGNDNTSWIDTGRVEPPPDAFEEKPRSGFAVETTGSSSDSPMLLSAADTNRLLNEHARTLSEVRNTLTGMFPDPDATDEPLSLREAEMVVLMNYVSRKLRVEFANSLRYIEAMLRKQLIAAIGKEVRSSDLDRYMRYHNEKLIDPCPEPFCYAIRRPEHYPDGILTIEEVHRDINHHAAAPKDGRTQSIATHVRDISSADPVEVPLSAAATVKLTGKTFLHGWVNHRFLGERSPSVRLAARARQFSSFVLMVGTMAKRNRFRPRDAIILRNKDHVLIPVLLREIPTASEFKHSTASLSPEQRRFARSFREMQLDSSVMGVCVVQIKPQLERLLGLPRYALTKEMKLTEDLVELFVEHQVPSDLVSCDDGDERDGNASSRSAKEKVANVKEHVASVMAVIAAQKEQQLDEQKQKAEFEIAGTLAASMERSMNHSVNHTMQQSSFMGSFAGGPPAAPVSRAVQPMLMLLNGTPKHMYQRANLSVDDHDSMVADGRQERGYALSFSAASTTTTPAAASPPPSDLDRRHGNTGNGTATTGAAAAAMVDPTAVPKILDRVIEEHDPAAAIRSTTLEPAGEGWTRESRATLLSKPVRSRLPRETVAAETARAFDLLDALSRSGSLEVSCSELHVLVCVTHGFERTVMGTVVMDNVNPIEALEGSTLLVASTILGVPARDLVRCGAKRRRLEASFPRLLLPAAADDDEAPAAANPGGATAGDRPGVEAAADA